MSLCVHWKRKGGNHCYTILIFFILLSLHLKLFQSFKFSGASLALYIDFNNITLFCSYFLKNRARFQRVFYYNWQTRTYIHTHMNNCNYVLCFINRFDNDFKWKYSCWWVSPPPHPLPCEPLATPIPATTRYSSARQFIIIRKKQMKKPTHLLLLLLFIAVGGIIIVIVAAAILMVLYFKTCSI